MRHSVQVGILLRGRVRRAAVRGVAWVLLIGCAVLLVMSSPAAADGGRLVQKLPEPVQDALGELAEAHRPSAELMSGPLRLQRTRFGSGTSWLPTSSPMYGLMAELSRHWGLMFRGNVFAGYAAFGSDRSAKRFVSTNTLLFMLFGEYGRHEIMPRVALSWEAFTNGEHYPSLLQSETDARSAPLHDRQMPQDLASELSLTYTFAHTQSSALQIYAALAGEPAFGPPAYNYRVSAFSDPLPPITQRVAEPLSYHGVFTFSYMLRQLKLEGSLFNARKSARRGYDLELHGMRSFAVRLAVNPYRSWNGQISYGHFRGLMPNVAGSRAHKLNVSVTYNQRLGIEANWATTFVMGLRQGPREPWLPSLLMESTCNFDGSNTAFGRLELTRSSPLAFEQEVSHSTLLGNLVLGYAYYFRPLVSFAPGVGVRGSMGMLGPALGEDYGTRWPLGILGFVQLRPAAMAVQK